MGIFKGCIMKEHAIQRQIVTYLRLKRWIVMCTDVMAALGYIEGKKRFQFINHYLQIGYMRGQPDLIAIKNGSVIFIEVKTDKGKQSQEQKCVEEAIKDYQCIYIVLRSLDEAMEYFT
jgi:hypothetical protein